jgi:hypothetical protein
MENTQGMSVLGEDDKQNLLKAGKWARFIAIANFVSVALAVPGLVMMLFNAGMYNSVYSSAGLPDGFFTIYALVLLPLLALALIVNLYLYNFATNALKAVATDNNVAVSTALANLGKYFRFNGIVLIVAVSFCVLIMVGAIIAIAVMGVSAL